MHFYIYEYIQIQLLLQQDSDFDNELLELTPRIWTCQKIKYTSAVHTTGTTPYILGKKPNTDSLKDAYNGLQTIIYLCKNEMFRLLTQIRYDFRIKTMLGAHFHPVVCRRDHVLFTLYVVACAQWRPTNVVLCFCFVCFRFLCSVLPVLLDCPFGIP